ncbi:enoyl-ACP reductase [Buchnera aphidicola]|uniref:Enoyl-[acyl-carrier-protein] reductase [NADH] n=1 Tax=Buchnera aphidicola (Artemisaphis artemisicola) TaxID=1241836 RepID=A0A4D6XM90_9GAMM|nr:enoyl-ACP reductase [Buchnera aphidicola]QCI16254.1 enoyl-ACP reductase [Buchnera aphidicola (Artemisaphis artemisicola)]
MGFLKGKKILITGISSSRSIAFGIAKSLYNQNAELGFVCKNEKICKKIKPIIKSMQSNILLSCDVSNDENIKVLFLNLKKIWKKFDGLVHSIAYCPKQYFYGDFIDNITRKGFNISHEISSYSFLALVKECREMLNDSSSLLTLSYIGSQKVIPNYNIMGVSKASLEASVRYMAYTLGKNNIRVNAISPCPIKTISSYKIKDFNKIQNSCYKMSCIKKTITSKDIGNVAAFLLSNLSLGITGSIIYVDNGFHLSSINIL